MTVDTLVSDDVCPKTGKTHRPDWKTVSVEPDGDGVYIDVSCADCGLSGCVGTSDYLADRISW